MTIGTTTTVSVVVTKNSDGSMNITSGDAAANAWGALPGILCG
jgi:hypothetical protein